MVVNLSCILSFLNIFILYKNYLGTFNLLVPQNILYLNYKRKGVNLKISAMTLTQPSDSGLFPFPMLSLGDVVVLTGSNGSGKTRLLKLIEKTVRDIQGGSINSPLQLKIEENGNEVCLTKDNANLIEIVNYSHFD